MSSDKFLLSIEKGTYAAECFLEQNGFVRSNTKREWKGKMTVEGHRVIGIRVNLPQEFPYELPGVFVSREDLPELIPHIEENGKICIATESSTFLDTDNPQQIISDALERTEKVITEGLAGENSDDFVSEFLSYWRTQDKACVLSICDPEGPAREVVALELNETLTLIADSIEKAETWRSRRGDKYVTEKRAFFLPFTILPIESLLGNALSLNVICELLMKYSTKGESAAFIKWMIASRAEQWTLLISLPHLETSQRILVCIKGPVPTRIRALRKRGKKCVRSVDLTPQDLMDDDGACVRKLLVLRGDQKYLTERGGANSILGEKSVAVAGCGAIGSRVVDHLASLGVGTLHLVDNERLFPENVHRHLLGMNFIRKPKVEGLHEVIGNRFPHIEVKTRCKTLQSICRDDIDFIKEVDLIVLATANETVELAVNTLLYGCIPRVHVWLEPLGLGSHVLGLTQSRSPGCYQCFFAADEKYGMVNRYALSLPNQDFEISYSGCSGRFTQFSEVDADRAALKAAECVGALLMGQDSSNAYWTWFGNDALFTRVFDVASRYQPEKKWTWERKADFFSGDCKVCSS